MTDDTQTFARGESKAFGVSIRAWLALILVYTTCMMSVLVIKVEEPLYSLVLLATGFYFGQRDKTSPIK